MGILETSPARLTAAAAGKSDDVLQEPLESGGWSARDILGHLRACQRTWGANLERVLDEDHPTFRYQSPRSTIRRTDFLRLTYRESLEGFATDRERLLARLRTLGSRDLDRTASVKVSGGRIQEHTAFSYAHRLAEHERDHVEHLEEALASR
jgi:uncharacterized damage-inducible protein DinB